jgi:hypothetical protein
MTTRKTLKIGSVIECRYFNTPDNRFYGEYFTAEFMKKQDSLNPEYLPYRPYVVKKNDGSIITLNRKEIKNILS